MIGTCDICGANTEVEKRTMEMFRYKGKTKPADCDSFEYVSCAVCERKIRSTLRIRIVAVLFGMAVGLYPLFDTASHIFLEGLGWGQRSNLANMMILFLPLILLYLCSTLFAYRPFGQIEAYRELRRQKFRLAPHDIGIAGCCLFLTILLCFAISWLWLSHTRQQQNAWPQTKGRITASVGDPIRYKRKSGKIYYQQSSWFQYEYEIDGQTFRGSDMDVSQTDGADRPGRGWEVGNVIPVFYNPASPQKSVALKADPSQFADIAWPLLLFYGTITLSVFLKTQAKKEERK